MLKNNFKKLLCYITIVSIVISSLMIVPSSTTYAMAPGEITRELHPKYGKIFFVDTRYNYKVKKSELIDYFKDVTDNYELTKFNSASLTDKERIRDSSQINWDSITDFKIDTTNSLGNSFTYGFNSGIFAYEEGEYIIFPAYSDGDTYQIFTNTFRSSARCVYEEYSNTLALCLYCDFNSNIFRPDINEDSNLIYIDEIKKGDTFNSQDYIIYDYSFSVKLIDKRTGFELNDDFITEEVFFRQGSYSSICGYCMRFDDYFSEYSLIDIETVNGKINATNETEDEFMLTFEVDAFTEDAIHYVDYITGEYIYKDEIVNGVTPSLYEDTTNNYGAWINSETNSIITEDELKGGMVVYGLPKEVKVNIKDLTDFLYDEYTVFKLNDNVTSVDSICYDFDRPDDFAKEYYPVLQINTDDSWEWGHSETIGTLYNTDSFSAKEVRLFYYNKFSHNIGSFSYLDYIPIYTYKTLIDVKIHNSINGGDQSVDDTAQTVEPVRWVATANGIDLSSGTRVLGEYKEDSFTYSLIISEADKQTFTFLLVPSLEYYKAHSSHFIFEPYNNTTYTFTNGEYVWLLLEMFNLNGNTISEATCTQEGVYEYAKDHNLFSTNEFRGGVIQYPIAKHVFSKSTNQRFYTSQIVNKDYTSFCCYDNYSADYSTSTYENEINKIYFDNIESFDEFANPYLLEKYNIRQYESLYNQGDSPSFELFPTYVDGETFYNINYFDDPTKNKYYDSTEWDNTLSFNVNSQSDIDKFNEWVNSLPVDYTGKHYLLTSYCDTYLTTVNRNNPYHTFSDSSLEEQVNNIKFSLNEENDETTIVPSTFFKSGENDKLYIEGISFKYDHNIGPYSFQTTTDALGHSWEGSEWQEIDINDISANTDIINANSNVTNLDTLLQYAENDVNETLLSNNDNKLFYKMCSRMGDAYELEIRNTHVHNYGAPTFNWNNGYTDCTATFICTSNDDTKTVKCDVTSSKVDATCTKDGKETFTATVELNGQTYTDVKEKTIAKLGHKFGEWHEVKAATYDTEGIAQRDCVRNDLSEKKAIDKLTKTAVVSGVLKDEDGKPIANKKVELHSNPQYTYTDANGYFEFENVELGEHTLKVFNNDNALICELSLTVDKTQSDADEKYVDKGFTWNKTITISDIALKIDGLKNEGATSTPTPRPTEEPTTEQPTEEMVPEEPSSKEEQIEPTSKEETTSKETSADKVTPPVKNQKKSEGGINPLGWLAAIVVGAGIILVLMGRKKLFIYDYIFELSEKDEYKGKTIRDARIVIAIKPYKDKEEVKLKKEPFIKENPDVRLSDIVKVSLDENRLPVLEKNLEIEKLFKDIYGWDCVEFKVIGYALGFEGTLTAKEYNNTPEEFRDLTVVDVMKASKLEFEAVARGRLMGFDGNVQASTMSIE